ncbi:MAG: hypothetical protein ACR2NF_07015, partial [Pirellulales bacterium]
KKKEEGEAEEQRLAAEQMAAEQKKKDAAKAEEKRLAAEQMAAEQKKKDAAAALGRQHRAFEQLSKLPGAVSLNKGLPNLGLGAQETSPVSIGDVAIDELVDFEIALAKPKNSSMELVKSEADGDRSWVIEVTEDSLDEKNVKKTLAEIYFKKGDGETPTSELIIKPASVGVAKSREYKLLLRSALLLFAKEPEGIKKAVADNSETKSGAKKDELPKQKQIQLPKQINLVEATRGQSDSVTIAKNQNTAEIGLGVPQILMSDSGNQTLSIDDLRMEIEVISPCTLGGDKQETSISVTNEMEVGEQPEDRKAYSVPLLKANVSGTKKEVRYVLNLFAQFDKDELGCKMLPELFKFSSLEKKLFYERFDFFVNTFGNNEQFENKKKQQKNRTKVSLNTLLSVKGFVTAGTNIPDVIAKICGVEVRDEVLNELQIKDFDVHLKNIYTEMEQRARRVPKMTQRLQNGKKFGSEIPNPNLPKEQQIAMLSVLQQKFHPLIKRILSVWEGKYDQKMDEWRNSILPLVDKPTTIQVKKIHTEAFHDGEQYEIVLVDENVKPASGQSKRHPDIN